jgi:hypothetical protein
LLLKISLRRPVLPDRRKQSFQLTLRKRRALRDRCQRQDKEDLKDEGAHAITLFGRIKFSKCVRGVARGARR